MYRCDFARVNIFVHGSANGPTLRTLGRSVVHSGTRRDVAEDPHHEDAIASMRWGPRRASSEIWEAYAHFVEQLPDWVDEHILWQAKPLVHFGKLRQEGFPEYERETRGEYSVFDRQRLVIGISMAVVILGVLLIVFTRGDVFAFWTWECNAREYWQARNPAKYGTPKHRPDARTLDARTLREALDQIEDDLKPAVILCEIRLPQPAAVGTLFLFVGLAGVIYGVSRKTW